MFRGFAVALAVAVVAAGCADSGGGAVSRSAASVDDLAPASDSGGPKPEVVVVSEDEQGVWKTTVELAPSLAELDLFLDRARSRPGVIAAALNVEAEPQGEAPDDPQFDQSQKNYASNIGVCCAAALESASGSPMAFMDGWDLDRLYRLRGSQPKPTTIAILDSGVQPIKELEGSVELGYDAVAGKDMATLYDVATSEINRHGTMVASVITAIRNNKKTIAGLVTRDNSGTQITSPMAKILPIIVSKPNQEGAPKPDLISITKALLFLINTFEPAADKASWEGSGKWTGKQPAVVLLPFAFTDLNAERRQDAADALVPFVTRLASHGVLVVASAAEGTQVKKIAPPASLANVMRVGGWSQIPDQLVATVPNPGSPASELIDVVAPAKDITVAHKHPGILTTGSTLLADGQSFSGAMVAAAAALRIGWNGEDCTVVAKFPQVKARIECLGNLVYAIRHAASQPVTAAENQLYLGQGMLSIPGSALVPNPRAGIVPGQQLVGKIEVTSEQVLNPDGGGAKFSTPKLSIQSLSPKLPEGLTQPETDKLKAEAKYYWWVDGEPQVPVKVLAGNGALATTISTFILLTPGTDVSEWESEALDTAVTKHVQRRQVDVALFLPGYGVSLASSYRCDFNRADIADSAGIPKTKNCERGL